MYDSVIKKVKKANEKNADSSAVSRDGEKEK